MSTCEVCGNEYDKAFELIAAGARHTFDSFECAIHAIAPICGHCKCRVIGHGVEVGGRFFCWLIAHASQLQRMSEIALRSSSGSSDRHELGLTRVLHRGAIMVTQC